MRLDGEQKVFLRSEVWAGLPIPHSLITPAMVGNCQKEEEVSLMWFALCHFKQVCRKRYIKMSYLLQKGREVAYRKKKEFFWEEMKSRAFNWVAIRTLWVSTGEVWGPPFWSAAIKMIPFPRPHVTV